MSNPDQNTSTDELVRAAWEAFVNSRAMAGLGILITTRELRGALDGRYLDRLGDTTRMRLQSNLARTRAELERAYPKTAKALGVVDKIEAAQFAPFLEDLPVEKAKVRKVRAFVPTVLRALRSALVFDPGLDEEQALAGLEEAVTAYLTTADRSKSNRP